MEFCKLIRCGFDPINGFVDDPMHLVFLGVTKQLTKYYLRKKYTNEAYSIRRYIKKVDKTIAQLSHQVPHELSRAPRGFEKNYSHYKGIPYSMCHESGHLFCLFFTLCYLYVNLLLSCIILYYLALSFIIFYYLYYLYVYDVLSFIIFYYP